MQMEAYPPLFGRVEELELLQKALLQDRLPLVGVIGERRVGKTSLVKHFCHQHRREFGFISYVVPGGTPTFPSRESRTTGLPGLVVYELDANALLDEREIPDSTARELERFRLADIQTIFVAESIPRSVANHSFPVIRVGNMDARQIAETLESRWGVDAREAFWQLISRNRSPRNVREALTFLASQLDAGRSAEDATRLIEPFEQPGIVDSNGHLVGDTRRSHALVELASGVNDEFLARLAKEPELLYQIHPRKFEELVAHLMEKQGFEVELTPISRDGGKDIYIARKTSLGSFLYLVECKRHAADNPVGIGVVQRLYGVVAAERATAGILATTSYFSKDAVEFQETVKHQLSLQDYASVRLWIEDGLKPQPRMN